MISQTKLSTLSRNVHILGFYKLHEHWKKICPCNDKKQTLLWSSKNLVWHRKFLIIEAFNLKSILAAVHFYSHDAARMYFSNKICCNFFIFIFMIFSNACLMVLLSKISLHGQRWCFIFFESFNSCKTFFSQLFFATAYRFLFSSFSL